MWSIYKYTSLYIARIHGAVPGQLAMYLGRADNICSFRLFSFIYAFWFWCIFYLIRYNYFPYFGLSQNWCQHMASASDISCTSCTSGCSCTWSESLGTVALVALGTWQFTSPGINGEMVSGRSEISLLKRARHLDAWRRKAKHSRQRPHPWKHRYDQFLVQDTWIPCGEHYTPGTHTVLNGRLIF